MINLETFLVGLMIISSLTGLVTEGVKKILVEHNVAYRANTLAGIVAILLTAITGVGYIFYTNVGFTAQSIVCICALTFMSWLCSMVGYDKVVEVFRKSKTDKGESGNE